MPPSKDPPPPLPLAPDRAALSNKIALLLSQRTSLLKSLAPSNTPQNGTGESPPRAATTTTAATARSRRPLDNDEDLLAIAARPNDGVGYVHPAEGASASLEDVKLRGRMMLGKRKKGGAGAAATSQRRIYESESESDEGRGSLGRAKRARVKASVEGPGKMEAIEKDWPASAGMAKKEHDGETKGDSESTAPAHAPVVEVVGVEVEAEEEGVDHEASKRQRKNQNKKRRKKEKKKGDGKAGEAPSGE
ncbi:hypothetical protein E4U13_004670 [Claviceps humidiphila]|uniref:Uncharacterized protein n=1 Tax=Claviceps humidiphila TaxID=1294629 RepID=A0A9P7TXB5_9HYPO|nr:hypothetical protein E4U13_004670 [Claviceps humidiphila]